MSHNILISYNKLMSNNQEKPKISFSYQGQPIQQTSQLPQAFSQVPVQKKLQIYEQSQCVYPVQQNYGYSPTKNIRLLNDKKEDAEKKVVAVIISFVNGFSYDQLFTTVEQKSQEGTKVQVYSCDSNYIKELLKAVKGQQVTDQVLKQLINQIKEVDPDCVVFNWQCSSCYGDKSFPEGENQVYQFVKWAIDHGHMTMFSDFSLKALIKTWKPQILGPNPFADIGQTSEPFTLKFRMQDLRDCPSSQLQIVGEMAEGQKCHVEAMGGTILYSVDSHAPKSSVYQLQILTIMENNNIANEHWKCKIGDLVGSAGHCLLTYKSGGHILTSMGHWVELMKIDTSEHKLFQIAQKQYGFEYAQNMKNEYSQMDYQAQRAYVSSNAVNFVQNSAPCANMYMKSMKKG